MIKTIGREELVRLMKSGERFKLVDVLSKESFEKEHIRGAISLPLDVLEQKAASVLEKNDKIVVYCASFECQASTNAANKLLTLGYTDVWDYKGGLKDYKQANLPLEGSVCSAAVCCSSCCS